jgi:hypothetical protein
LEWRGLMIRRGATSNVPSMHWKLLVIISFSLREV